MSYTFPRPISVSDATFSRNLRASTIEYLKWALLEAGSYRNVPEDAVFGRLRLQKDNNFSLYKVYSSRRGYWVWEDELTLQTTQPVFPSVLVNGSPVSNSTYKIDWENGRIIFNTALTSTDMVTANYACREIVVYDGGDRNVREIDFDSTNPDDLRLATAGGSGVDLEVPNTKKAHLPAIIVNSGFNFDSVGYEMGSGRLIANGDITLQCYSDNGWYLDWMHDILILHKDVNISSFDCSSAVPTFMSDGTLNPSAVTFPEKCQNNPGPKLFIKRASSRQGISYGSMEGVLVTWNVDVYAV